MAKENQFPLVKMIPLLARLKTGEWNLLKCNYYL
jgi:hypothetical protein